MDGEQWEAQQTWFQDSGLLHELFYQDEEAPDLPRYVGRDKYMMAVFYPLQ